MIIQPFIENCIKHGFNNLIENNGFIKIEFIEENDVLKCFISDNGIGMKESKKQQSKFKKGLGKSTSIAKQRLALINKKDKKVAIQYLDLKSNRGTKLLIEINL